MFPLRTIDLLARLEELNPELSVVFDYNHDLSPQDVDSYRGFYDHLAIEPGEGGCTVSKLTCMLEASVGSVYYGYKGGVYQMGYNTPLWCASYGETGSGVVGVRLKNDLVIIETEEGIELSRL